MRVSYTINKDRYKELMECYIEKNAKKIKIKSINITQLVILIILFRPIFDFINYGKEYGIESLIKNSIYMIFVFIFTIIVFSCFSKYTLKSSSIYMKNMINKKMKNSKDIITKSIEISGDSIKEYFDEVCTEIKYEVINNIEIDFDSIIINYLDDKVIFVPIEAFMDKDEMNNIYNLINKNKNNYINETKELVIEYRAKEIKYITTEKDIEYLEEYYFSTSLGKEAFKFLKTLVWRSRFIVLIFMFVALLVVMGLLNSIIIVISVGIIVALIDEANNGKFIKKSILRQEIKKFKESKFTKEKKVLFTEEVIILGNEKCITTYNYKLIKEINLYENFIILQTENDENIYIPNKAFNSKNDKEKVIQFLINKSRSNNVNRCNLNNKKQSKKNLVLISILVCVILFLSSFAIHSMSDYMYGMPILKTNFYVDTLSKIDAENIIKANEEFLRDNIDKKNINEFNTYKEYDYEFYVTKIEKIDKSFKVYLDIFITYEVAQEQCSVVAILNQHNKEEFYDRWYIESINEINRVSIMPLQQAGYAFLDIVKSEINSNGIFTWGNEKYGFAYSFLDKLIISKEEGPFEERMSYLGIYTTDNIDDISVKMKFNFNTLEWSILDFKFLRAR